MAKKKLTAEEREARQAADRQLRTQAQELLTDPGAVVAMVDQLLTVRSPKVLRYSLRNQAMLTQQADERGLSLVDVDSFRGWLARGRCVRKGEKGLRIVSPKGREAAEDSDEAAGKASHAEADSTSKGEQVDESESRTRFRMTPVFDISQTDGVEDSDELGEPLEEADPAAALTETITGQLTRRGYEITEDATAEAGAVDDGNLVIVPAGRPVRELARALAVVLTAEKTGQAPSSVAA